MFRFFKKEKWATDREKILTEIILFFGEVLKFNTEVNILIKEELKSEINISNIRCISSRLEDLEEKKRKLLKLLKLVDF